MDKDDLRDVLEEMIEKLTQEPETPEERKEKRAYRLNLAKYLLVGSTVAIVAWFLGQWLWWYYYPHCVQFYNALPVCK